MPNLSTHGEITTRRLLANRPTWMLLTMWEVAECQRDDSDEPLLIHCAARLIDWTIDELDARYPLVMVRFHALDDMGHAVELQEMFRDAYRDEIRPCDCKVCRKAAR